VGQNDRACGTLHQLHYAAPPLPIVAKAGGLQSQGV